MPYSAQTHTHTQAHTHTHTHTQTHISDTIEFLQPDTIGTLSTRTHARTHTHTHAHTHAQRHNGTKKCACVFLTPQSQSAISCTQIVQWLFKSVVLSVEAVMEREGREKEKEIKLNVSVATLSIGVCGGRVAC